MTLFKYVLVLLVTAGFSVLTAWLGGESTLEGILQVATATGVIAGVAKASQLVTERLVNRWAARDWFAA